MRRLLLILTVSGEHFCWWRKSNNSYRKIVERGYLTYVWWTGRYKLATNFRGTAGRFTNGAQILCIFLETSIKYGDHCITEKRARLISSVTQDIVFDVTRGKVMQCKHFLLALGLHSLTGFGKIIDIVQKLGHCISYNLMSDFETAQTSYSLNPF